MANIIIAIFARPGTVDQVEDSKDYRWTRDNKEDTQHGPGVKDDIGKQNSRNSTTSPYGTISRPIFMFEMGI